MNRQGSCREVSQIRQKIRCIAPDYRNSVTQYPKLDFKVDRLPFTNASEFYRSLKPVPTYADNKLPLKPTDIKGVDSFLHAFLGYGKASNLIPRLCTNNFFTLQFYPHNHEFAKFRKSTVAYTFTNKAGYQLNNPKLESAFLSYKGKYKNDGYFKSNCRPLSIACSRSWYRKFIKRALFKSIRSNLGGSSVEPVSGLFKFTFNEVPRTRQDQELVSNEIDSAVRTLISNKSFVKKLLKSTITSNNSVNKSRIIQGISHENTLHQSALGGYKRLPFFTK